MSDTRRTHLEPTKYVKRGSRKRLGPNVDLKTNKQKRRGQRQALRKEHMP